MHQQIKTNIKLIKLINGDDIVCHLPEKDNQLPDDSPLLRLEKPLQVIFHSLHLKDLKITLL
jgi:hypothetical protein